MIDIHCHILPNIDDGPKNVEDSIAMARQAASEGITKIIATPHHKHERYDNEKSDIIAAVKEFNDVLVAAEIPLTILPGQETRIYGEILADYQNDQVLSLCDRGKYIFLELPSNSVPRYTGQLLYDLQLSGLTPIIVHPERNSELIETPDLLYKFVKNGALTQITTSSLTGHFGKKIKQFTEQLIDHQLTHFLASDAHNQTSRPFRMQAAISEVENRYGIDKVFYFQQNAELLERGDYVFSEQPERIEKLKIWNVGKLVRKFIG
jgi:protein-tyrosine phosphatase